MEIWPFTGDDVLNGGVAEAKSVRQISAAKSGVGAGDDANSDGTSAEIQPIDQPGSDPAYVLASVEPWPKKVGGIAIPQPRPSQ